MKKTSRPLVLSCGQRTTSLVTSVCHLLAVTKNLITVVMMSRRGHCGIEVAEKRKAATKIDNRSEERTYKDTETKEEENQEEKREHLH